MAQHGEQMNGSRIACRTLVEARINTVVALPDSLLGPLCREISTTAEINYIQVVHESIAVGIATGLSLTGIKTLVILENSGLRNACETIARFHLSHHLFTTYLISHRGGFGERNWWGLSHHETMEPLLRLMHFRWEFVRSLSEFPDIIRKAYDITATGQCSAALIAEPSFLEELL